MRLKTNLTGFGYAQLGAYEVNPNWLRRRYAFYCGIRRALRVR
jgi:hypothetical protein